MEDHWQMHARRRALQRTIAALWRESLLPRDRLHRTQGTYWLALDADRRLELAGSESDALDDLWQAPPSIRLHQGDGTVVELSSAGELLHLLASAGVDMEPGALARLVGELDNSAANDALAMRHRDAWGRRLRAQPSP